mmetsp:Transcript_26158/g.63284  ORF Transcript_26158/g.63284 Transcript_26158/m.63284 type:complete len:177 (-) Transcript_26158:377-907(-)
MLRAASRLAPRGVRHLAYPAHTVLPFPSLSPTMTSGNISKYLVKVGDEVQPGDRVAEVETDKATVDFDVVDAGFVAKFLLEEGAQDVPVGTPMLVMAESAEDVAAFADYTAAAPAPASAAPAPAAPSPAPAPAAPAPAASPAPSSAPAAPVAKGDVSLPTMSGRIYYNETKGWFRA